MPPKAAYAGPMSDPNHDSAYSWVRLAASTALGAVGGVGMWSVVVALPAVQADFGASRGAASLPYALTMLGFAFGGVFMGRLVDRYGIVPPLILGILMLGGGYLVSALSPNIYVFAFIQGVMIGGLGSSVAFGPLMADVSHWFRARRGIAMAICASGNYIAGALWSPIIEFGISRHGWRATHVAVGLSCLAIMLPLAMLLRRPKPEGEASGAPVAADRLGALGLSPTALTLLLAVAGVACCVAMAMPQVHIVAYCGDLGYGPARGATMLSLMLGFGIVSRVFSGYIADRIGGLRTLLIGSVAQAAALVLYLFFDGLAALYVISALFGLFQGGIVPSYAIIVREYFAPGEAATRTGIVLMATLFGMSFGGWLSGVIFDMSGSYRAAFVNGILWNIVNMLIVGWLLTRWRTRMLAA
jgi:MFS family permease